MTQESSLTSLASLNTGDCWLLGQKTHLLPVWESLCLLLSNNSELVPDSRPMRVRQWRGRPIGGQTLRCELGSLWSKTTCSKSSCSLNGSWSETLIVSWKVITIMRLDSEDEIRLQFAGVSWLRPGTCHLITLSSQNWFLSPRIINLELTEHWAPYFKWKLHILQETGGNLMFVFNVYTAHDYNWAVSLVKTGDDPGPPRQLITGHKLLRAQIMAIQTMQTWAGTAVMKQDYSPNIQHTRHVSITYMMQRPEICPETRTVVNLWDYLNLAVEIAFLLSPTTYLFMMMSFELLNCNRNIERLVRLWLWLCVS